MKLAIQIALFHSAKRLPEILKSLCNQSVQDFEVFCYENSESQEEFRKAKASLEASGIKHHMLTGEANIGFGNAHNALWRLHDARFVLLLNDDARLAPTFLEKVLSRIESNDKIASVSGLVYRWAGDENPSGTESSVVDTAGLEYHCLANVTDRFAGKAVSENGSDLQRSKEIFGVSGAVALLRRSAVERVSPEQLPFDPSFYMYKEDVELAIRLRRGGFVSWYEPSAVAFHKRALKSEAGNLFARIKEERKRSKILRKASLVNQWKIDVYHLSCKLGWDDVFESVWHEGKRKMLNLIASPGVFFSAAGEFFVSFPALLRRRAKLRRLNLPNIRLRL